MSRKSVTVKAAWFGGACVIVAALIAVVPGLLKSPADNTVVTTGDQHDGSIVYAGGSGDITINYNLPPTETREAIRAIEKRLDRTDSEVKLGREELRLLSNALKDLDQRTSGIEKLPDGRTRLGTIITGNPTVVIDEHNAAVGLFRKGDFTGALEHSQRAIDAHEASQQDGSLTNKLNASAEATMYYVGAMCVHQLKKHDLAYRWAEKAQSTASSPDRMALLAATLFNVNRYDEAVQMASRGLT